MSRNENSKVEIRIAVVIFLLAASLVRADELFPTTDPTFSPSTPYPHGLRLVTFYGGFAEQPTGQRQQLYFGTAGLNYYFADNWAFGFEGTGLYAAQPDHDSTAGGANIILRTHLINEGNFSFFGDFAAGVLEANHTLPPQGTDFNFTIQTGVGSIYQFDPHWGLICGLRYMHLSNARQEGPSRNPSLNGIQGYVGFVFRM
jgi:hypothetical protein